MRKTGWYLLAGMASAAVYITPFMIFPVSAQMSGNYLRAAFSGVEEYPTIFFFLREFLLYVTIGGVFFNFYMRDIETAKILIFPREKVRYKWFFRKTRRLIAVYASFWCSFVLLSALTFCLTDRAAFDISLLLNLIFLFTTSFLCYFLFVLSVNILTLFFSEYLALLLTVGLYFVQYFSAFIGTKTKNIFLPIMYSKYSLFGDRISYLYVLFSEAALISGLLLVGFIIVKGKKFRMGEV